MVESNGRCFEALFVGLRAVSRARSGEKEQVEISRVYAARMREPGVQVP